jgi:branched-chain amino acid transport system permease protein
MGNPKGALIGGLLLGLLESITAGYISSQYKDAVAFIVILVVLFVMPQGLFGRKAAERV